MTGKTLIHSNTELTVHGVKKILLSKPRIQSETFAQDICIVSENMNHITEFLSITMFSKNKNKTLTINRSKNKYITCDEMELV
jgi:hypothetical protein